MKNKFLNHIKLLCTAILLINSFYSCSQKSNVDPIYSEIPDANFKSYLKTIVPLAFTPDSKFISNHPSVISYNEIMNIKAKKISSLSGIEYFISLTNLSCDDNELTSLDLSKNVALTMFSCSYNKLKKLDLSKNVNLTRLECYKNELNVLDVSKNSNLEWLNCESNKLKNLNLGDNKVLRRIHCSNNQLVGIDLKNITNLTRIDCFRNQLSVLDVSQNKSLTGLYCYDNQINCLDISNNKSLVFLAIDYSNTCCHPSIKEFSERGGDLLDSYRARIFPLKCP